MKISTMLNAFTRTVKSDTNEVLREAIAKFDFAVSLEIAENDKYTQVCQALIINAIKNDIQAIDRTELWDKAVIAQKFSEAFNSYDIDKLYELVCLNTSGRFGLKSFVTWCESSLIPSMKAALELQGKSLPDSAIKTIIQIAKQGNRMPEPSLATMLQWIEKYIDVSTDESVEAVLNYLTNASEKVTVDLDSLGL